MSLRIPLFCSYNREAIAARKYKKDELKMKKTMAKRRKERSNYVNYSQFVPHEEEQQNTTEDDDVEQAVQNMSQRPRKPKDELSSERIKRIEKLPLIKMFYQYLISFEGKFRKPRDASDHSRRICRLLYELQDEPNDASILWQDESLDQLRNSFFLGNDLLQKPRAPNTLKTYVVSLKLWLKFMLARKVMINNIFPQLNSEQFELIQSAIKRLECWPSSFRTASQQRKNENRKKAEKQRLRSKDFEKLTNTSILKEVKGICARAQKPNYYIEVNEFCTVRDYLMLMLVLGSAQRSGALANLTVDEFEKGEWIEHTYVTKTLVHKTQSLGPAKLYWDNTLKCIADAYLNNMRQIFATLSSHHRPEPGRSNSRGAFFIAISGKALDESRVSRRLIEFGKKLNIDLPGMLKSSNLRKSIISLQREQHSTITKDQLARQMTHDVRTAEKYYNVCNTDREDVNISKAISKLTTNLKEIADHESKDEESEEINAEKIRQEALQVQEEQVSKDEEECESSQVQYSTCKMKALTPAEKAETWVESHFERISPKIVPLEARVVIAKRNLFLAEETSSKSSSVSLRKTFSEADFQAIQEATSHLPPSSITKDIIHAIGESEDCQYYQILKKYTRQQLRDKFRNIKRAKKR